VCRFVRSLMAFVYQEIKGLLTYLVYHSTTASTRHQNKSQYTNKTKM